MHKFPFNKLIIVIFGTLLVPIFSYSIYQYVKSDDDERLIKSIYDRQLESILFSVNQYCWDIFSNWRSEITGYAVADAEALVKRNYRPKLDNLFRDQRALVGAFLRVSETHFIIAMEDSLSDLLPKDAELKRIVNLFMAESGETLDRSVKLAKEGYFKPMARPWNIGGIDYTLLIFPILHPSFHGGVLFGGLLIDNVQYIREIVARRFSAMAEEEFVFAVQKKGERGFVYHSNMDEKEDTFEASAALWILPDLELKVKMAGTTLADLSHRRSQQNLMFLGVVNIIFLIGLIYVVHNVNKEMEIAKIKSNLVANVSHEIRTPVALIRLYAETLEMGRIKSEAKRQKYYKTILAETVRLSQLINNILDFSKIESRMKEYHLAPGDLAEVVRRVLEMYEHNFEQNGFRVECNIEENLPEIEMDADAVTQAFVNLLDNAMKYSTDDRYIGIQLKQRNEHIVLSVTDHGIGIPQHELKKIFQKFYRVGDSLVHNTKGSGLGLALVEHIMTVHRGRVEVESTVGRGSTFSLIFPKIQGA
ncbi:MAG: HAMP domain-containing histidine kinase [candidate division KSB1 bacterium]|nr:HAMP domain-containing histidine kinase [candidate division KSB1 bacterium]MDZ7346044.1 HAMP domain-containing histidine kinase [candidate division KSB1 bacterium]